MSPMYPEEYDQYAAHAAHAAAVSHQHQHQHQQQATVSSGTGGGGESKRDKRRREMTDRVQRLHEDTVARRDRVYHELSQIYARTTDDLLPPPVFPVSSSSTLGSSSSVSSLPPSISHTDPLFPDLFPPSFLFRLHELSMQRSNRQLEIRLFHTHQVASARRLYDAEVERIEDEYEGATKGVVERLLEGVEERRRKLMEEKEGEGVSLDAFLDPQRAHGTRRMRGGSGKSHTSRPHLPSNPGSGSNGAASPAESVSNGRTNGGPNGGTNGSNGHGGESNGIDASALGSLLGLNGISDPFGLASSLLPGSSGVVPPSSLATNLSSINSTASLLSGTLLGLIGGAGGSGGTTTKRKSGGRTQPGLPPTHYLVQSGTYSQFGKSIAGLSALRGEEVEGDLVEVRRKRQRVATASSRRRNYE
ncbi:Sds3p [Sporobolomyces salmoneus]|uniref:Sds3p n=1 Tax=Sporobolomyces salmoneus TaxID=183962 RepID=UPI00317C3EBA